MDSRRNGDDWPSYAEIAGSIWSKFMGARCLGMSAELGFWFLYSMFPFVIFLLAISSLVPFAPTPEEALRLIQHAVPPSLYNYLEPMIEPVLVTPNGWLAAGTLVLALWSAAAAVLSLVQTLDQLYEVRETRPLWETVLISLGLTIMLMILSLGAFMLLVLPHAVLGIVQASGTAVSRFFLAFRVIVAAATSFVSFVLIYAWAPNARWHWQTVLPGALVATAGFYGVSAGFRFYLVHFAYYSRLYGALGTIIALMTWMYLVALIILLGGLVDGEIRHVILRRQRHGRG